VRSATTSLRGHPSSVPEARRWTVSTLSSWGLDVTAWSAAQVVSELATNCTLHARSDFEIRLSVDGGCVRVEAVDRLPGGPQARTYSSTSTTGRGLRIVEGLSSSWGVVSTADGKTVWALLPVEDRPSARGDEQDDEQPRRAPVAAGGSPAPAGPSTLTAAA
jgi:anti-sigma regulatory factor (Ser/Thr protein kinase)